VVTRARGEVQVGVRESIGNGILGALGRLVGIGRAEVRFDVRMPREAALRLDNVNADVIIEDVRGGLDIHTVTGDVMVTDTAGSVAVTTISGDVRVSAGSIDLKATTTSGDVHVSADRLEAMAVKAVSGDVTIEGALSTAASHTAESVSGDLEVRTDTGLTVELLGLTGSLVADRTTRREMVGGRRVTIVGDGAARLRFRTVSGDLHVSLPRPGTDRRQPARPASRVEELEAAAIAATPSREPRWGSVASRDVPDDAGAISDLEVLRALERGDIDVDEAARRLAEVAHG
jgi:hypothetical protein